jgi:hypothetical protein
LQGGSGLPCKRSRLNRKRSLSAGCFHFNKKSHFDKKVSAKAVFPFVTIGQDIPASEADCSAFKTVANRPLGLFEDIPAGLVP